MRLKPETKELPPPLTECPSAGRAGDSPSHPPDGMDSAKHYRLPLQPPFTRSERGSVTLLCGGLTPAHERLIKALLESRGFRITVLPNPTLADYQTGRRHANTGFCNPLYYMSGSLINYLRTKEAGGSPRDDICTRYVYFTTNSTGPCRLGFYEQEFRNVLANAGYGGLKYFLPGAVSLFAAILSFFLSQLYFRRLDRNRDQKEYYSILKVVAEEVKRNLHLECQLHAYLYVALMPTFGLSFVVSDYLFKDLSRL
jgi:hypothetical protein